MIYCVSEPVRAVFAGGPPPAPDVAELLAATKSYSDGPVYWRPGHGAIWIRGGRREANPIIWTDGSAWSGWHRTGPEDYMRRQYGEPYHRLREWPTLEAFLTDLPLLPVSNIVHDQQAVRAQAERWIARWP